MSMPVIVPGTVTREQAISDIIESIALQETGLSHIINAEGEKIQKVVATASSTAELLSVNQSVSSTINAITRLEMVLHSKLELLQAESNT